MSTSPDTNATPPIFISRPIKHRAWTGREMVVVQSLCTNSKGAIWYGPGNHMGWAFLWPNAEWTVDDPKPSEGDLKPVMQWTGVMDSQGIEVYEGDIISRETPHFNKTEIGTVLYDDQYTGFAGVSAEGQGIPLFPSILFKVIGNVFENPDLLKS